MSPPVDHTVLFCVCVLCRTDDRTAIVADGLLKLVLLKEQEPAIEACRRNKISGNYSKDPNAKTVRFKYSNKCGKQYKKACAAAKDMASDYTDVRYRLLVEMAYSFVLQLYRLGTVSVVPHLC